MVSLVTYELEAEKITIPGFVYDHKVYVIHRQFNKVCRSVFAIIDITTDKEYAKRLVSKLRSANKHKTSLAAIQASERRIVRSTYEGE